MDRYNNTVLKWAGILSIAGLLLMNVVILTHRQENPTIAESPPPEVTPESEIRSLAKEDFDAGIFSVEVKSVWSDHADIQLHFDPSTSARSNYRMFLEDSAMFLGHIFKDPKLSNLNDIAIFADNKMIDDYGQESVDEVAKLMMQRSFADRCNFEELRTDPVRFYRLLDRSYPERTYCWFHPALRRIADSEAAKEN